MPVSASIYQLVQPKSIEEFQAERDARDLRALQLLAGRQQFDQTQKAAQRQDALQRLLQGMTASDPEQQAAELQRGGFLTEAQGVRKSAAEVAEKKSQTTKQEVDTEKTRLEMAIQRQAQIAQAAGAAVDQPSWDRGLQIAQSLGADVSNVPRVFDPNVAKQLQAQALTGVQQLDQIWKQKNYQLQVEQQGETVRHNKTAEGLTARGQDISASTTIRGQNMTDARQRELNEITKTNKAEEKKAAADEKAVTKFSDTIQKEGIPELETAVAGAEGALNRYPKGQVPGIGAVKNALPAFTMSDEGKDVRQSLAAVRNIVLNARSGAAVTDQELRRLVEEIGTGVGMSEDDIRKGLSKVRTRLDAIKANAAAGVSDNVLSEYQTRGGIKIERGTGKTATPSVLRFDAQGNPVK